MDSIFSRTYKYKQTKKKNNLENFLNEILTYCLQTDIPFRERFFTLIDLPDKKCAYTISSQKKLNNNKQPDVYIENDETICLIECKVDASEGDGQLDNYDDYLTQQTNFKHKKLIFLTKYRSNVTKEYKNFHEISWLNVSKCIDENNTEITQQMMSFLNEKKIILKAEFNKKDELALTAITDSIFKLNEVLDMVKNKCEEKHSIKFNQNNRATKLINGGYYDILVLKDNLILDVGFFGLDTNEMTVGVRIFENKNSTNYLSNLAKFKSILNNWIEQDNGSGYWIGSYKLFTENGKILTTMDTVDFITTSIDDFIKLNDKLIIKK